MPLLYAEGRYDPRAGTIEFPCIRIVGEANALRAYSLGLEVEGDDTFSITSTEKFLRAGECDARYSLQTGSLVSEVRVIDDIYAVELEFDSARGVFTLRSAEYVRLSETSVWVVSDGINELYLGGTIHILQNSDFPLPSAFLDAYEKAATVILETDPAVPLSSEDFELFNLPPGETVLDLTSEATEKILDDFFRKFDRTLEDYSRRRPEFFNSVIYIWGARSYDFGSGVDDYLGELALSEGKPTAGLETARDQLQAIIDGYANSNFNWNLSFLLRLAYIQSGQILVDLRELIGEWREGRLAPLTLSNEQYQQFYPGQYESILAQRNRNWIPVIESYLETPEVEFILGGLAHFAGPDNVLALLEDQGYTVSRYIPYKNPFDALTLRIDIEVILQ